MNSSVTNEARSPERWSGESGRFEQAAGGTFFLDEIGEIDSNIQVKLLRALDPGVFERVGGNQSLRADVRLIAATNRDLARWCARENFGKIFIIGLTSFKFACLPSGNARRIFPLLANAFLKEICERDGKAFRPLSPEAMETLIALRLARKCPGIEGCD